MFMLAGTPSDTTVPDTRDRHQLVRVVGHLVQAVGMADEVRSRSPQQHVIILRRDDCIDGNHAIAAGLVLDDHRLAPHLRQPVGIEARADVGAGTRPERQDHAHRFLRPGLGVCKCADRGDRESGCKTSNVHDGHPPVDPVEFRAEAILARPWMQYAALES
jgi:hypothetical protein